MSVCRSPKKQVYETQFEADIAVAHARRDFGVEFEWYPCNQHFHVRNVVKENRTSARLKASHGVSACKYCWVFVDDYLAHAERGQHRKRIRKV